MKIRVAIICTLTMVSLIQIMGWAPPCVRPEGTIRPASSQHRKPMRSGTARPTETGPDHPFASSKRSGGRGWVVAALALRNIAKKAISAASSDKVVA